MSVLKSTFAAKEFHLLTRLLDILANIMTILRTYCNCRVRTHDLALTRQTL